MPLVRFLNMDSGLEELTEVIRGELLLGDT